jgi:predicted transposase/invertase (TIGR01784 family)
MYDNVCKFLAESFSSDFATWLLGEEVSFTELSPSELSLEPIRADALILLQSDDLILHLEFQTLPKRKIPFRMADYRLRGYRRFEDKRMHQVVIYLQPTSSQLAWQTSFSLERTVHEYEVIRLWEQPTSTFLNLPGLLPFAVLSQTSDKTQTLQNVAQAIEQINNSQTKSNIAAVTAVLAGLVLEKDVVQRILRSDIMRESVIYQDILQEGLAEGRNQGLAEGRVEGRVEERQEIAINLLNEGIAAEIIAKTTGLTIAQIQQLQSTNQEKQQGE